MNLNISNVQVSYGGKEVLRRCSYAFEAEGIYMLTGENGSGKSTLLRICSLLEKPDSGIVEFYEGKKPLQQNIHLRRKITLVLPGVGLFNASVYDNVNYGLKLRNVPGRVVRKKSEEALDFVRLSHKKNQNALTLSSGESKRLGIARALILEPEILFLDEPTASVDKNNVAIIEDIILHLKNNRRMIIMTTHNELQARRLGDKVLHIDEGVLQERNSILNY